MIRIIFSRLTLAVSLLLWTAHLHAEVNEIQYGGYSYTLDARLPDWVKPAKPARSKGKPKGQGVEYLLSDTQIKAGHEVYERYSSSSTLLHSSQGVSEGSEIHIDFNPAYQKLVVHGIKVFRKGKFIRKVGPKYIRLLQREEDLKNGILDGVVSAVVIIPDTRIGDRIDSSYTVIGRNPVYGEKVFGSFSVNWLVDVALVNSRLVIPSDIELQIKLHNNTLKSKVKRGNEFIAYQWRAKNVKAVNYEGDYPPWFSPFSWIEFSEYQSWSEVELWSRAMYESIDQDLKDLKPEIRKLKKRTKTKHEFASKALRFVQEEIRYMGMEFGENSHMPHSPTHVLSERYGDCKDKSNLLVQLLKSQKIEAYSALVSHRYRGGIVNFLPSPAAFDHVIVKAEIEGKTLWLDPTRTFQGDNVNTSGFTNFGKALLVGHEWDNEPIDVTALSSQKFNVDIVDHFKYAGPDKPTLLTVTSSYQGGAAEYRRSYLAGNSPENVKANYVNYYAKIYPKIEMLGEITVSDNLINNMLVVTEKYKISDFSVKNSKNNHVSLYAGEIANYIVNPEKRIRTGPLHTGYSKTISQKIIVDFDRDVGLKIDSKPFLKKNSEFKYRSRSAYYSNRFEFSSDLELVKSWVDTKDVAEYLSEIGEVRKDVDFSLNFDWEYKVKESAKRAELIEMLRGVDFE